MLRPAEAARRPSMAVQSLLFDRSAGWNASKAKAWAQSHGYRYGKVDITDQYVRIRQFDPKGSKVKRTIPFGRGIRAVVAREEMNSMSTVNASRRRRPSKKKTARKARRAAPKRARRRARKVHAVATRRRRRKVRVEAKRSSHVMEAKRRVRRRRRPARAAEAWKGDSAGHAKAAKKGHRRRKARAARKSPRRRRKARETMYEARPRRRRHAKRRSSHVMEAKRSRRRYHAHASKRSGGMGAGALALMIGSGGIGFVLADGLDRMLATYNPSGTTRPTDKFTSDGSGTLANTLNVAAMPNWKRLAAGVGVTAVPAVGAMFVKNPYGRASLEGLAVGAGISTFKMLWNNVLMPMLIGKDTSTPALQKSYIARLYPAEVAAHINQKASQTAVSSAGSGALSEQPSTGVGAPAADVGPFALSGDSPYPSASDALRAGVSGDSPYPSASDALRAGVSGDSPYPTAAAALRKEAGLAWQPGPPPGPGPGPQAEPHTDPSCGCIGDDNPFLGFVGEAQEDTLYGT